MLELLGQSAALGVPNSWKIWFNWSAWKSEAIDRAGKVTLPGVCKVMSMFADQ
jgi:hypothetical protein